MNHNFVSWEVTQLLPEKNPYFDDYIWYKYTNEWAKKLNDYTESVCAEYESLTHSFEEKCIGLREAWTWGDVRNYLTEKGYFYEINIGFDEEATESWKDAEPETAKNVYYYNYTITDLKTAGAVSGYDIFDTYEEAREAAILKLLSTPFGE